MPEALERAMRYAPEEAKAMAAAGVEFSARGWPGRSGVSSIGSSSARGRGGTASRASSGRSILVNYKVAVWTCLWQQTGRGRTAEDDRFVRVVSLPLEAAWRVVGAGVRLLGVVRSAIGRNRPRDSRRGRALSRAADAPAENVPCPA